MPNPFSITDRTRFHVIRELRGGRRRFVVINLAGRSVNCRYNAANRREILDSRVDSTRVLGEAMARAAPPPRVWLQASTATIYAHRYDAPNDEATGILGGGEPDVPDTWKFSIDVARAWEAALDEAPAPEPPGSGRSSSGSVSALTGRERWRAGLVPSRASI